jgi:hypothetical protein
MVPCSSIRYLGWLKCQNPAFDALCSVKLANITQLMKTHIIVLLELAIVLAVGRLCTQPQRSGVMSFSALSQRDHLTALFENITTKTKVFNTSATINDTTYNITNLRPGFFYNDNNEKNLFVDSLMANVTSGNLVMGTRFNYSYGNKTQIKGTAFVKVSLDTFYFTKELKTDKGYLEWEPIDV